MIILPWLGGPERVPDWEESEPGFRAIRLEIKRLLRRARTRWFLTLLIVTAVTALLVAREARKQRKFPATIVMAIEEHVVDEDVIPQTNSEFTTYVDSVVLTDRVLLPMIEEYELHSLVKVQPELALQSFREDLEVEAYRNTFLLYAPGRGDVREARLGLTFWANDPDVALTVARQLAGHVVDQSAQSRQKQVESAKIMADRAEEQARVELQQIQGQLAEKEVMARFQGDNMRAWDRFELKSLREKLKNASLRLDELQRQRNDLSLVESAEQTHSGLQFRIADYGKAADPMPKSQRLSILGFIVFLILLPIVAIAVGAFDTRIYNPEDVEKIGLVSLGRVRPGKVPPLPPTDDRDGRQG